MKVTFRKKVKESVRRTPDEQYKEYLSKHVNGVKKVYEEIF